MGLFSWIGDKWKTFTGEKTYEEADALYNKVMDRFNNHKKEFEKSVDKYTNKIENHVSTINKYKTTIKTELLPEFADRIKHIKDVSVSEYFVKECFDGVNLKLDTVKKRSELFLIDFDKNPIKNNALAILSLGFYTRKKAKETLLQVKEEEKRIEEEIERMDSEISRLEKICESLSLVELYYSSIVDIYKTLLKRLDNSVNFLMIRSMCLSRRIDRSMMSVKMLSQSQVNEINAVVTCSKILKTMAETKITTDATDTLKQTARTLEKGSNEIESLYKAA